VQYGHGIIKFFFSEHMMIKLNSGKSQVSPIQYNIHIFSDIFYTPPPQIKFNIEFFFVMLFFFNFDFFHYFWPPPLSKFNLILHPESSSI